MIEASCLCGNVRIKSTGEATAKVRTFLFVYSLSLTVCMGPSVAFR